MKDYFVYLPKQPASSIWGCVATAAGYTNVPPGMTFPPSDGGKTTFGNPEPRIINL